MDKQVLGLYIKPDPYENNDCPVLNNTFQSYKTFVKDLRIIFERKIPLLSLKENIKHYIKFENVTISESLPNYSMAYFNNTSYNILVNYDIKFVKEELLSNGQIKTDEIEIRKDNSINQLVIPALVCYQGTSPLGGLKVINKKITGGFFITNKGVAKYMTNRKELNNTNGKFKKQDNVYTFSFNSIAMRFDLDKIIDHYVKIEYNQDIFKFDIMIDKLFIRCNVILLICFFTNYSIDELSDIVLSIFNDIRDQCRVIFLKTKLMLDEKFDSKDYPTERIKIFNYLLHQTREFLKTKDEQNKDTLSKEEQEKIKKKLYELSNKFLPHLDTILAKGIFLISIIRQFFTAIFQNEIYPGRDSLIGKRISPVGCIFEELIVKSINTNIKEINAKIEKNYPINKIISEGINFDQRINNTFVNVFNMKEVSTMKVVKPIDTIGDYYNIHVPNLVIHSGTIVLTRNLNSRDLESTTISFEDPVDTPDHSDSIGLIRRIGIASKLVHYDFEEHLSLFNNLKDTIYKELDRKDLFAFDSTRNIICSIVDNSELPIAVISNEEAERLIKKIREYKQNNYLNFRYIGIEKTPCYYLDKIVRTILPTDKIFQLKFNISCKRYIKPFLVVNDGKVNEVSLDKYSDFTSFFKDNPGTIEFLDPAQLAYSNVAPDLNTFKNYSEKIKKKYDFIELTSESNFGCVAVSSFGFNLMQGVRATYATAQQKQIVLPGNADCYNKYDTGMILLNPYERPCVTNTIIEETNISLLGKGHHLLVGFFSFEHNVEDALIFRQKAIDRGALSAIQLDTFKDIITSILINVNDPHKTTNSYEKLDTEGMPKIFSSLTKEDALFKKVSLSYKKDSNKEMNIAFDNSENYPFFRAGIVERTSKIGIDNININILTSSFRKLEVGDKVVNQCAQKGTVGIIYDDYLLPRTKDGRIPDVIINSSSIVSRQTYALYLQAVLTKLFSEFPLDPDTKETTFRNFPIFSSTNMEDLIKKIEKEYKDNYPNALEEEITDMMFGNEIMYDSIGNKIDQKMMICPLMYNRAKQTSIDHINVRGVGRLTKAGIPVHGKKKGGGQRFGEMENDVLIVHGVSNILQEITTDVEMNNVTTKYCDNCFTPATKQVVNNFTRWYCIPCENQHLITEIVDLDLTQAAKLQIEGLRCRGVNMKIKELKQKKIYNFDVHN